MARLGGGKGFLAGLAIGIGAGLILPVVAPGLGQAVRPKAKAAVKAGLLAFDRTRVALAELREKTEDIVAEASVELVVEREAEAQARTPPRTAGENEPAPGSSDSASELAGREPIMRTG